MSDDARFLGPADEPLVSLEEHGVATPDTFSALRFVMAMVDGDTATVEEICRTAKPLPLLVGVAGLAIAYGEQHAGEKFRKSLDLIALNPIHDTYGLAEAYRAARAPESEGGA
jgi:hypothetical protein